MSDQEELRIVRHDHADEHAAAVDWSAIGSVLVHYRVWDVARRVLLDSSHGGEASVARRGPADGAPLPVRLGRRFAVRAIERLLPALRPGDVVEAECGAAHAGDLLQLATAMRDVSEQQEQQDHDHAAHVASGARCGCGPGAAERMARDADLTAALLDRRAVLELRLVAAQLHGTFERDLWEYAPHERPDAARRHRAAGNDDYAAGRWDAARAHYELALGHLDTLFSASAATMHDPDLRQIERACRLNLAACCLKMKRPQQAVEHCTAVLVAAPHDHKALFRRAQAYAVAGDAQLDLAERDLVLCESLPAAADAANEIQRELRAVRARLRVLDQKDRQVYARMFV